jgi:hypothetical protein
MRYSIAVAIISVLIATIPLNAESTNNGGLLNSDGCYCTLTGPDVVCKDDAFIVHAHIAHNDGSSSATSANYQITVTGVAGTASPTAITTCPSDTDITVTPTGSGKLTLHVGSVTHDTTVLTTVAGSWTVVHNADPDLPQPFDETPYDKYQGPVMLGRGTQITYHYIGVVKHSFSTLRQDTDWKPSSTGTDCGQTYKAESSIEGSIGTDATLSAIGVKISITGKVSVSLSQELGGEANKRWRAYPVWPQEKLTDHVTSFSVKTTSVTGSTGFVPHTPPADAVVAIDYLAGKDFHTEAACCK